MMPDEWLRLAIRCFNERPPVLRGFFVGGECGRKDNLAARGVSGEKGFAHAAA